MKRVNEHRTTSQSGQVISKLETRVFSIRTLKVGNGEKIRIKSVFSDGLRAQDKKAR